jgi:tetratricopeptide (TPR) repeat protein
VKRFGIVAAYSTALFSAGWLCAAFAQTDANIADQQVERARNESIAPLQETLESQAKTTPLDAEQAANTLKDDAPAPTSRILDKLPSLANLDKLKAKMRAQPNNLDHYFAYAQMANELGEYALAAQAYEQMLERAPHLDRIRLDLGSAYLRIGEYEKARAQLKMVLEKDLPDQVRNNVKNVLAKVDSELNEHDITGLMSAGINWDSNANSAPRDGEVVIQDFAIPLSGEQLAQKDIQGYYSLGLNHTYRPRAWQSDHFARRWKSSANWYQSKQSTQEAIDIKVYSFKTGPEFQSKQSGITVAPALNHSVITLNGHTYLRNTSLEGRIDVPMGQQWFASVNAKAESRDFVNSPDVSTFEDREGDATQGGFNLRYIATPEDIFNLGFTYRREHTTENFFDNQQIGTTAGYTRILPYDSFGVASLGYKRTNYEAPDPLISVRTRHENEMSAGLTFGTKITDNVTATIGYQFRSVHSNIRNYDYDNHRLSASISRSF